MHLRRLLLLSILPSAFVACSPGSSSKDPVAVARFENERHIKEADITQKQLNDADFLVNTSADALLLSEMGRLAGQKGASAGVRSFAPELASQLQPLQNDLQALARKKTLTLPTGMGDERHQIYQELSKTAGAAFDKAWLERVTDRLEQAAEATDDMDEDAFDGDIRAIAAKYLPLLRQLHERTEQIAEQTNTSS